jgi:hypothetical protein
MKAYRYLAIVLVLVALFAYAMSEAKASPNVTITLLNELPATLVEGETYIVDVLVESETEFTLAAGMVTAFFPGYLHGDGGDRAQHETSVVLHLPMTAARSTEELPGGVTSGDVRVGVFFQGGERVAQFFPFEVAITSN